MQKAILSIGAVLLGLASLAGAYSGGSGTPADPYQIATAEDLIELGQTPDDYGKSFVLGADIDLAGRVFDRAVIAPDTAEDIFSLGEFVFARFDGAPFSGRFDGRGHVIRNLYVDDPEVNFQGLFGKIGAGAEIANLGLDDARVNGLSHVGSLVGQNDEGSISSCHITGTVSGEEKVGGLVGHNDEGTISLSHSAGTVSGTREVGGLVGDNDSATISLSHSTATVHGETRVGGLAGDNNAGTIASSYSTGMVSGTKDIGGLAGRNVLGGAVSSCHSTGMVSGADKIGGLVGDNTYGAIASSFSTGRVYGSSNVGGLVAYIHQAGTITSSCSTSPVHGTYGVGGLVGWVFQSATITSSYSTGSVFGGAWRVGGLAGTLYSGGTVSSCYRTGSVSGNQDVGGLVGYTYNGSDPNWVFSGTIASSFWDIETTGQTTSEGGIGLTTQQMLDRSTYVQAEWDFMNETANGTEDLWWMPQDDTPRLWWQYGYAYGPSPANHAGTGQRDLTLQWSPGGPGLQHDVYFGDDQAVVADANTQSQDVYRGRLSAETLSYDIHALEPGKTYYWRIDGVSDANPPTVHPGLLWSFTITDYIHVSMLEDFESYDDHCNRIFFTWQDGFGHSAGQDVGGCDIPPYGGNGTGAVVGHAEPPYASHVLIHEATQSMPLYYDNTLSPWFSETQRTWPTPQDWTIYEADSLTLYFRGEAENTQDPLYIALVDSQGRIATVYHANADAVLSTEAQVWHIPLSDLDALGVDVSAIETMVIGVGNWDNPQPSAIGLLYIDDVQLTKRGF